MLEANYALSPAPCCALLDVKFIKLYIALVPFNALNIYIPPPSNAAAFCVKLQLLIFAVDDDK